MAVGVLRQQTRMRAAPVGGGQDRPLLRVLTLVIRLYLAAVLGVALVIAIPTIGLLVAIGWLQRVLSRCLDPL